MNLLSFTMNYIIFCFYKIINQKEDFTMIMQKIYYLYDDFVSYLK